MFFVKKVYYIYNEKIYNKKIIMRMLTWIKPTGNGMHIWNYLGMFKPFLDNSKWKDSFLMIADYHALTSVHEGATLRKNRKRMLIEIFSLLPENSDIVVFEQSKVSKINDITWILSSVTPLSMILRAHSYKDSQNKNSDINMAVFNYPILMTSDIIAYDMDLVPVWKDQKQHLEFARDIAQNFNKTYWVDLFKLPEPFISDEVWLIPWTDGRKMSKSYDNFIWLFDSKKVIKKKIMSIQTDDTLLEEPKDYENCNVFALIKFFAIEKKQEDIKNKYKAWWYWYWHAKLELLEIILNYFREAREKYEYYENNFHLIEEKLKKWNTLMTWRATKKYNKMMNIIWLS